MDKIRYYKGLHKVKVVMESVGYYTIEALEVFLKIFLMERE